MPGGLLDRGAAAEVKMASGERSGATGGSCTLQHQDPRAGGGRTHGCAAASDTEADYHDVDVVRPRRHVVSAESCWYFSSHWRSPLLLLDVVEELPHLGREMRDLHERHPGLRGRQIGEAQAAGHHALLHHRCTLLAGGGQGFGELLEAVRLDADVVQTRP